jgi:AraC-like DNA-binding protein
MTAPEAAPPFAYSGQLTPRVPALPLRPYVRNYDGYFEDIASPRHRTEVPSGEVVLILGFSPGFTALDRASGERRPYNAFVAGIDDGPVLTESAGVSYGVQVNMTPLGAYMLFGVPMHTLANRVVEINDVLGARGRRFVEQLEDAGDWDARFDMIDALITTRFAEATLPSPAVQCAWRRLRSTGGRASIASLAGEAGCSRKHLVAQFHEQIGLPPKTMGRVLRFDRARRMIERHAAPLSAIAAASGYYDQAHLNRDFMAFAGSTPAAWRSHRGLIV